jgi:hypothetical protein
MFNESAVIEGGDGVGVRSKVETGMLSEKGRRGLRLVRGDRRATGPRCELCRRPSDADGVLWADGLRGLVGGRNPQSVLNAARARGVLIRDVFGNTY